MKENYGIYYTTNNSSNGYYKILQSRKIKEKHLFNVRIWCYFFTQLILDRDNT